MSSAFTRFTITQVYGYNLACGSVAQLAEQLTLNQWVTGSSPVGVIKNRREAIFLYVW